MDNKVIVFGITTSKVDMVGQAGVPISVSSEKQIKQIDRQRIKEAKALGVDPHAHRKDRVDTGEPVLNWSGMNTREAVDVREYLKVLQGIGWVLTNVSAKQKEGQNRCMVGLTFEFAEEGESLTPYETWPELDKLFEFLLGNNKPVLYQYAQVWDNSLTGGPLNVNVGGVAWKSDGLIVRSLMAADNGFAYITE